MAPISPDKIKAAIGKAPMFAKPFQLDYYGGIPGYHGGPDLLRVKIVQRAKGFSLEMPPMLPLNQIQHYIIPFKDVQSVVIHRLPHTVAMADNSQELGARVLLTLFAAPLTGGMQEFVSGAFETEYVSVHELPPYLITMMVDSGKGEEALFFSCKQEAWDEGMKKKLQKLFPGKFKAASSAIFDLYYANGLLGMAEGADELNAELIALLKKLSRLITACRKTQGGPAVQKPIEKLQNNVLAVGIKYRRREGPTYLQKYKDKIEAFKATYPNLKHLKHMPASIKAMI